MRTIQGSAGDGYLTSALLPAFLRAGGLARAFPFSVAVSITRPSSFGSFPVFV